MLGNWIIVSTHFTRKVSYLSKSVNLRNKYISRATNIIIIIIILLIHQGGRRAVQTIRSAAECHSSPAWDSKSASSWPTQVLRGRPLGLFQAGQGQDPPRASTLSLRDTWAGVPVADWHGHRGNDNTTHYYYYYWPVESPVVWSLAGPVQGVRVWPCPSLQSNSSMSSWFQPHKAFSKSQMW